MRSQHARCLPGVVMMWSLDAFKHVRDGSWWRFGLQSATQKVTHAHTAGLVTPGARDTHREQTEGRMDDATSFGTWLRRRRKALDLTQADLARRVGCTASLLRKLEAEERRPS